MRLCILAVAASCLALVPQFARGDVNAKASLVFVLDCSAAMEEPWQETAEVREASLVAGQTRFDAALDSLQAMLHNLAHDGSYEVGVVLYGHRLAWEASDEPQMIEQTAYLDQTLGYQALSDLLPGDDVEVIQPLGRFGEVELDLVRQRLETVRPWGEPALYYGLVKALDSFSGRRNASQTSVIVLTAGNNHQWLARNRWTSNNLSSVVEKRAVPIHFVGFGIDGQTESQASRELQEIAKLSAGSLEAAVGSRALVDRLHGSYLLASSSRSVAPPAVDDAAAETPGEAAATATLTKATRAEARNSIEGRVVLYSEPIRRATVRIEGGDQPPVKTDREGAFRLDDVAPGRYQLIVEAIAYNTIYQKTLNVTLEAAPARGAVVEINLAR